MLIKGLAPPAAVEDVVNDSLLVFLIDSLVGLHFLEDFVIGRPGVCHLDVCFFSIGIDEPMLGAVFAVETPAGQAHKISYNQWSAQQAERAVTS